MNIPTMSLVLVLGDNSSVCNWLDRFGENGKNIFISRTKSQLQTNAKVHYLHDNEFTTKLCDATRNTVIIGHDLNPEIIPEYLMKFVINGYLTTLFENIDWIVMTNKESIATLVLRAKPHVIIVESNQFKEWYGHTNKYADRNETLVVFNGQVATLNPTFTKVIMTIYSVKDTPLSIKILKYAQNNFVLLERYCDITFEVVLDAATMPSKAQDSLLALNIHNTWITSYDDIVNYLESEFNTVSVRREV